MATKGQQVESLWAGLRDNDGEPLAGGLVTVYAAGTTTPASLYTDPELTIEATNPVVLDANGRALVYGSGVYTFVVKDSDSVTLYTLSEVMYQRVEQVQILYGGTSTGSSNAYACSSVEQFSSYQPGMQLVFQANHANTGAATMSVNGAAAKSILKNGSALTAGEIPINSINSIIYLDAGVFALASQTVSLGELPPNCVDTTELVDSSVTTAKLAASAVTTAKLLDSNVTTAKLAGSAVTTATIADSAVTTAKLLDSNVTTAKLAGSAVTTATIADSAVTTAKLLDSNVTTAKVADTAITFAKIQNITSARLLGRATAGSGAVEELSATSVRVLLGLWESQSPLFNGVTTSGGVNVGTNLLAGGTIHATSTVTGSNLSGTNTGDQTITLTGDVTGTGTGSFATTIASGAVSAAKLASDAVTTAKILDANVTGAKLALSTVDGERIRFTNNQACRWRNAANSGDVTALFVDAEDDTRVNAASSHNLRFCINNTMMWSLGSDGTIIPVEGSAQLGHADYPISDIIAENLTLSGLLSAEGADIGETAARVSSVFSTNVHCNNLHFFASSAGAEPSTYAARVAITVGGNNYYLKVYS